MQGLITIFQTLALFRRATNDAGDSKVVKYECCLATVVPGQESRITPTAASTVHEAGAFLDGVYIRMFTKMFTRSNTPLTCKKWGRLSRKSVMRIVFGPFLER